MIYEYDPRDLDSDIELYARWRIWDEEKWQTKPPDDPRNTLPEAALKRNGFRVLDRPAPIGRGKPAIPETRSHIDVPPAPARAPRAGSGENQAPPQPAADPIVELPHAILDAITRWHRMMHQRTAPAPTLLNMAARDLWGLLGVNAGIYPHLQDVSHQAVVDALQEIADIGCIARDEAARIIGAARAGDAKGRTKEDREARRADQDGTPEPHALPSSLLPVAPFDMTLMPAKLRPWVQDIAERMQCPPDYIAVSVMAGIGSLIGLQVSIRPLLSGDWTEVANLWAMVIGRPGMMKSPAMEAALWPLKKLAASAAECHKMEMQAFERKVKAARLIRDADAATARKILKGDRSADVSALLGPHDEQEEPTLRRYIANDSNVASLGLLLQRNPNGVLVYRDELVSLMSHLDREENTTERSFYLTAWAGNSSYTFDRIGRGLNQTIDRVCLSVLGSTQPAKIAPYLSRTIRGQGGDGLLQRFGLMVWPDISPEWEHIDRWPDPTAKKAVMDVFGRLDVIDLGAIGAKRDQDPYTGDATGLPYLRFSIEGYDLFRDWRTKLEERIRAGDLHPVFETHLSKYRKLVPALALILHLVDRVTEDDAAGPVSAEAVQTALRWAAYLETHARRAYGCVLASAADTARAILAKIKSGDLKAEFVSPDVWRPGWARLNDREVVEEGIRMLVDYDWLTEQKMPTGGRPKTVYRLNPKAKL